MSQPLLFPLADRWKSFGPSIFTEMSAMARQVGAINLAQGFPDFPGPDALLQRVSHHLHHCHNQYSISYGEPALRQALVGFLKDATDVTYDPETEITVTSGATEAIFCAINAMVNPGDRVIVFEPYYDSYSQCIANAGGTLVPIRLYAPDTPQGLEVGGWAVDWAAFDAAVAGGFRLLLLNTPHNPTGRVFSRVELERIAAALLRCNAFAVCDEVYEHLTYDGVTHESLASIESVRDRVARASSAGKSFGFTGFKVGWITAAPAITKAIRLVHQVTVFSTNAHCQLGLADMLQDTAWLKGYLTSFQSEYSSLRNTLTKILQNAGFVVQPSQGTYFLMASYAKRFGDRPDVQVAKELLQQHKVAALPTSPLYVKAPVSLPWLRFAFCKKPETLARVTLGS